MILNLNSRNKPILYFLLTVAVVQTYGSIKESLIDIFSVGNNDFTNEAWYHASENRLTQSLRKIGTELFTSISLKKPFDDTVDDFKFTRNLRNMASGISFLRVEIPSFVNNNQFWWRKRSNQVQTANNPLTKNNQEKIIKIKKFLHFFLRGPSFFIRSNSRKARNDFLYLFSRSIYKKCIKRITFKWKRGYIISKVY